MSEPDGRVERLRQVANDLLAGWAREVVLVAADALEAQQDELERLRRAWRQAEASSDLHFKARLAAELRADKAENIAVGPTAGKDQLGE